jgi:hypothetical protein
MPRGRVLDQQHVRSGVTVPMGYTRRLEERTQWPCGASTVSGQPRIHSDGAAVTAAGIVSAVLAVAEIRTGHRESTSP